MNDHEKTIEMEIEWLRHTIFLMQEVLGVLRGNAEKVDRFAPFRRLDEVLIQAHEKVIEIMNEEIQMRIPT